MNKLIERREYLESLKCSKTDDRHYRVVIEAVGDSDEIEIDFDEFSELLDLDAEGVEDVIQEMADLSLVEVDWTNQILW